MFKGAVIDIYGFGFKVIDNSYHNMKFEKETILTDKKCIYHAPDTNIKSVHHKVT